MKQGTRKKCLLCGERTNVIYNIKMRATPICATCGRTIAYQEFEDMFRTLPDRNETI